MKCDDASWYMFVYSQILFFARALCQVLRVSSSRRTRGMKKRADWGGDQRTRRSTSGGLLLRGVHTIGQWSRTQQVVACSSAEAELNGICKAAAEGLAARNLSAEFFLPVGLVIKTDASAAKGVVTRCGAGRIKHLEVRQLWVQERERVGDLSMKKIPRGDNYSDLLTHHTTEAELIKVLAEINVIRRGPSFEAPARGGNRAQ